MLCFHMVAASVIPALGSRVLVSAAAPSTRAKILSPSTQQSCLHIPPCCTTRSPAACSPTWSTQGCGLAQPSLPSRPPLPCYPHFIYGWVCVLVGGVYCLRASPGEPLHMWAQRAHAVEENEGRPLFLSAL